MTLFPSSGQRAGSGGSGVLNRGFGGGSGIPGSSVPVNTVAPDASGGAAYTDQLSTTTGTWTGTPTPTFSYQWKLSSNNANLPGSSNAATYTPNTADAAVLSGASVYCAVTATNTAGAATANSDAVTIPAPPVPAFRSVSAEVEGASPAFTLPTGTAADDILVLVWNGTAPTLSGWERIATQGTLSMLWKRAGVSEGNPTFSGGSGSGRLLAISGCVPTGIPFYNLNTGGGQSGIPGASAIQTAPSVTTSVANEFIIHAVGGSGTTNTGNMNTFANANLSGFQIVHTDTYTTGRYLTACGLKVAAGATGVMQNTSNLSDSTALNGLTIALAPIGATPIAAGLPAFRAGAWAGLASVAGFTPTRPPGTESGDLLVLAFGSGTGTGTNSPSGWTKLTDCVAHGGLRFSLWWRIADLTAADVPAITWSPGGQFCGWSMVAVKRANASTPIDASAVATSSGTGPHGGAAVSSTVANTLGLHIVIGQDNVAFSAPSSGHDEFVRQVNYQATAVATQQKAAAGAITPITRTSTSMVCYGWALAIKG